LKFNSLKFRVISLFGFIIFIILLIFSIGLYYTTNQNFLMSWQNRMYKLAQVIDKKSRLGISIDKYFNRKILKNTEALLVKNGDVIARSSNFKDRDFNLFKKNPTKNFFIIDKGERLDIYYRYIIKLPKGNMTLFLKKNNIDDKVEDLIDTLLFLEPLLLLGLLVSSYIIIEKILQPIRDIAQIAKHTSVSNFPEPIPVPENSEELKEMVISFNSMVLRLKEGIEQIERFNIDISHELKTPLTVLQGEVEIALRRDRDKEELKRSLEIVSQEIKTLKELIENLLFLSQNSIDSIHKNFYTLEASETFLEILQRVNPLIKEKGIKLSIKSLNPCEIKSNPSLLRTLFLNLLDNAIKYTPKGKRVTISLRCLNNQLEFSIKDEGIGIDTKELKRLTNRFYRADEARSRKIPGFGLGLSIVKRVVELHKGELEIHSQKGIGTEVKITI